MQTANTQEPPGGELQKSYRWRPDEAEMVNAIMGAAWDSQMCMRSGIRPTLGRILRVMLFRGRNDLR